VRAWRISLATCGVLLGLYGAFRLLTNVGFVELLVLAAWLIGAVVIHDGLLSPAVLAVGWFLARRVPPRARRYLQGFLVVGGLLTVVAIPLMLRRDSQPVSKAMLQQNYGGNLSILLALAAAISLLLSAIRVARRTREASSPVS
jgi:hypothetical protein